MGRRWFTAIIMAGLAASTQGAAQGDYQPRYAIVSSDHQWAKSAMLPHWTPSDTQARAALSFLYRYAISTPHEQLRDLSEYQFQVFGVTANDGNNFPGLNGGKARLVVLQGVCATAPASLKASVGKAEIAIIDGGNCFFRAYIDVEKERMAWLSVNGVA